MRRRGFSRVTMILSFGKYLGRPLERLLLETDAPYLAPQPRRGKRNEPSYLPWIAERLAQLRGRPVEEIAAQTSQNAREANSGPILYPYLRQNRGIAMLHSLATAQGSDYRDNDPAIEPLVELYQGYYTTDKDDTNRTLSAKDTVDHIRALTSEPLGKLLDVGTGNGAHPNTTSS